MSEISSERLATKVTCKQEPQISVVIPCLNEERTLRACVEAAFDGIRRAGIPGEVIVADNGSTDRSVARALAAGARVVHVSRRGYGAALQAGFNAARGKLMVMGDADLSYDFREIPKFVAKQTRSGADLVIGDRLGGRIEKGAMPWSHRLIGNPLISATIRFFFRAKPRDCYCGLRLITKEAWERLDVNATGMEFALEMIVLATLAGMKIEQVPIVLHVDGRDHRPHLKTLRDGYRSFRFLFRHAPITVYLLPGFLLILGGAGYLLWQSWREVAQEADFSLISSLAAAALLLGWLMILLGTVARVFATGFLDNQVDPSLRQVFGRLHLEHGVAGALVVLLAGVSALGWGGSQYHALSLLGLSALVIAFGTLLGGLVVSLMGRAIPDNRFYLPGQVSESLPEEVAPDVEGSDRSGQNEAHSLSTQHALAHAPRYNEWLLDAVAGAIDGARSVLDVGCSIGNLAELAVARLHDQTPPQDDERVRVVGLELIEDAVAQFHQRFGERPDLEIVEGNILNPPSELRQKAPFDAALCFNVLEHVEEDVAAMRRIRSLLRPSGRIGIIVPGGGDTLYGSLDALDRHYRRYTPPRLRSRLERAGFEILDIRHVNFVGYFLWFLKARVMRSKQFRVSEVASFDRMVPILRRIDRWLGPPRGQSIAVVARRTQRD